MKNYEDAISQSSKKIDIKSEKVDLKKLINRGDKYGDYAWSVISKIIKYSSSLVPGITDKFNDIDEAMRLGFNWSRGPFEMLKEIGVNNFFQKIDNYEGNKFLENLFIIYKLAGSTCVLNFLFCNFCKCMSLDFKLYINFSITKDF